MHTNVGPMCTNGDTGVVVVYVHIYIYMDTRIPPSFALSLGSYTVDFLCLFLI